MTLETTGTALWRVGLVLAAIARPAPAAAEGSAAPFVLMIADEGQRPAAELVADAIRVQLGEADIGLEVEWVAVQSPGARAMLTLAKGSPNAPDALCLAWYEAIDDKSLFLYLATSDGSRALVRRILAQSLDAQAEAAALIVHSAAGVLVRGGTIDVVEPAPLAPAEPQSPSPVAEDEPIERFGFELQAAFLAWSTTHPFVVGAGAEIFVSPLAGLSLFGGYLFWNTMYTEGDNALISIARHPISVGLSYGGRLRRVALTGRVAAVVDYTVQETHRLLSTDPTATGIDNSDWLLSLAPELGLSVDISRRLALLVRLGAEIPLGRVEYEYRAVDGDEAIESPWPVQPRLVVGARFGVL